MKSFLVGLKNVLLWSYARGTWQYDVLCGLIVLTLLVWPSQSPNRAAAEQAKNTQVSASKSKDGKSKDGLLESEIEWAQLRGFLQEQNRLELLNSPREAIVLYLQADTKNAITLASLEPYGDSQGHRGYRVRYSSN